MTMKQKKNKEKTKTKNKTRNKWEIKLTNKYTQVDIKKRIPKTETKKSEP